MKRAAEATLGVALWGARRTTSVRAVAPCVPRPPNEPSPALRCRGEFGPISSGLPVKMSVADFSVHGKAPEYPEIRINTYTLIETYWRRVGGVVVLPHPCPHPRPHYGQGTGHRHRLAPEDVPPVRPDAPSDRQAVRPTVTTSTKDWSRCPRDPRGGGSSRDSKNATPADARAPGAGHRAARE